MSKEKRKYIYIGNHNENPSAANPNIKNMIPIVSI